MVPTTSPPGPPLLLPDPDDIRAAIDAADERARLLRRLLRLAIRLRLPLQTADTLNRPPVRQGGGRD